MVSFADDIAVFCKSDNYESLKERILISQKLKNGLDQNLLTLNIKKNVTKHTELNLKTESDTLLTMKSSKSVKYLGIHI